MATSADLCVQALALERGLLPEAALARALTEAASRGRPLERHLLETGALSRDVVHELEVASAALARGCGACRKVTYLLPGRTEADSPCAHCGGALQPRAAKAAPPAPAKAAPAKAAPAKAAPAKAAPPALEADAPAKAAPPAPEADAPEPDAPPAPRPAAPTPKAPRPKAAPARPALVDDDEDWAPLPPWVGPCKVEALLAEDATVLVYAGKLGELPVAVRTLRPEHAARRRAVDAFHRAAQAAPGAGLTVIDLGVDGGGVPLLVVDRPADDATLGERLRDLAAAAPAPREESKSDTGSLVFAQLQKQREQLLRDVAAASRRRDRVVGRFVLLEPLVDDGCALWRGYDTERDEVVAVRVLEAGPAAEGGHLVKPLQHVLAAAERLRSPQVLPLKAFGLDGPRLFLVRDLHAGRPLVGGPTLEDLLTQAIDAALGLAYLHGQGLVHGGLHPAAIFVDGTGHAQVLDVGLAPTLAAAGRATSVAWRLARAGCVAPGAVPGVEPVAGAGVREDVYALGAILWRAAAPLLPDAPGPVDGPPEKGSDALAVALRCLADEPADRYGSMIDLARDLKRVHEGQVPTARQPLAPKGEEGGKSSSSVIGTLSGVFKRFLGRK